MIVIYHSRDLDGYCSGAICKKKYPDAKLIGYDYGQPFPWSEIPDAYPVIMVDVSLPMKDMLSLLEHTGDFTWIDHHASAIKDCENFEWPDYAEWRFKRVLEDGISACEGAWKYLFPDKYTPKAVQWLGEYDTWRNSDKEYWDNVVMPFQFGMRLGITNADNFPQELLISESDMITEVQENFVRNAIDEVFFRGNTILSYQKEQNILAMKGSFVIEFEGLRALCCNGGSFNSSVFDSVWDEEIHDVMIPFKFDGKKWSFSLYTTKDIDLSIIAKKYGGGGHKKACGFQLTEVPDFIFNTKTNI